ncbi:MAG TPA: MFS transporter [Thermoanaerobaculia bacterium]|nr:MFS transporter [Thermoanaerobaculia bacterium]
MAPSRDEIDPGDMASEAATAESATAVATSPPETRPAGVAAARAAAGGDAEEPASPLAAPSTPGSAGLSQPAAASPPGAVAAVAPAAPAAPAVSAWSPLRNRLFRWLWIATVASNIGTWLQNVGASWMMTSLTTSATLVALVQAATGLPSFLLALPAGALADVVDRRRLLLVTQGWMTVAAAGLGVVTLAGLATPGWLLGFTFLLGLGSAANNPAWQAIIPELVPRRELPGAIALGSIGFNIARAAGPALGGLIVAAAGPGWTFILNAVSFLGVMAVLYRWRRPEEEAVLPGERVLGAMRTGVRYVRHSPEVLAPIARGASFIVCGGSLWALLPVVARGLHRGAAGYGLLLAALGVGAVSGAMALPRLKRYASLDLVVAAATLTFAAATLALALLHDFPLLLLMMLLAGGAWLSLLSSLNVAVQTAVPSWVRARALSVYLLIFFGGLTAGSALWGALAERFGIAPALCLSAAGQVLGLLATRHLQLRSGEGLNLAPSRQMPAPIVAYDLEPDRGPVLVSVEYLVRPEEAAEFASAMQAVRRIRLRDGAMEWGLFADAAEPGRYTEVFLVKSWLEHLRQHERATVADRDLVEQARRYHHGGDRPAVRHLIAEPLRRET